MATNNIEKQSFGQAGALYLKDASVAVTGQYCAITSLDDATYFSAITWDELNKNSDGTDITGADTFAHSSATIPKGVTIYGQITGFTLGAGRVIAYNQA
tara:strand:- start:372 stop:668 length:297 start_codon:yes stop_codon:yes gene_type:complete